MWIPNKQNWHEPLAYLCAAAAVATGLFWGFKCDPAWLGRAGSVVTIIGVFLASSRKIDTLHEKVLTFLDNYRRSNPNEVSEEYEKIKGTKTTAQEARSLEDAIYESIKSDIGPLIEERRQIFKRHEIFLVVVGTLLNGFGEWLIKLVLRHAT